MLYWNERPVALHHHAFLGKIKRYDRNILQMNVLPDIHLRPIRKREDADRFTLVDAGVEDVPQLGPLIFRIPLSEFIAERVDALLGARFLFVAPRSAKRGVIAACRQRVKQRTRFQKSAASFRAEFERTRAVVHGLLVGMNDEVGADLTGKAVAKINHFAKFVSGVDMQERKRQLAREKCLLREPHHDGTVLADRVKHHGLFKFGDHLAQDVDAFCFKHAEMGQCSGLHVE